MEEGYPKAKYNATKPVACVNDSTEEKALGKGWFDHPLDAKFGRKLTNVERGSNELKAEAELQAVPKEESKS